MILLSLASVFLSGSLLSLGGAVSGLVALAAVVLLLPDVRRLLFIQAMVLIAIGIVLMIVAARNGQDVSWLESLSRNTTLLSMVVAVGLLTQVFNRNFERKIGFR